MRITLALSAYILLCYSWLSKRKHGTPPSPQNPRQHSSTKFCYNLTAFKQSWKYIPQHTLTYCIWLLTGQGKVVLVCTLCCLDVSVPVGVMMNLKIGLRVLLYFIGGKPRSPWRDPEKHKNASKLCPFAFFSHSQSIIACVILPSHAHAAHWLITCPPAAQAATSPYCPPSFCSRCATVVTSLQPVAPNGWPRDREPPHRLNFSMGGVPTYTHT